MPKIDNLTIINLYIYRTELALAAFCPIQYAAQYSYNKNICSEHVNGRYHTEEIILISVVIEKGLCENVTTFECGIPFRR